MLVETRASTGLRHVAGRFVIDKYYRLPQSVRQLVLVRRRSMLWQKAGIIFVHIPKAAGTSFSIALYGRFMGHVRAASIRKWASEEIQVLPSFAVTRNPWDRLVSAYRFATRGHGLGGDFQAVMFRAERYRIPEFESFERFVTDWLARRDLHKLDPVFQPQSHFLCDRRGHVLVEHVGRVEALEQTYEYLRRRLGSAPVIGHSNRSGERTNYRDYYTPYLVEAVRHIYAEDVQRFGYNFEGLEDLD